jgi:drug/metabolite transporter (DMT)-like permease
MSVVGGILIAIFGAANMVDAVVSRSTLESVVPGSSTVYLILGAIAFVAGLAILLFGLRLRSDPKTSRSSGNAIVVLAVVSFVGGGGLFLGLVLAFVGGLLARTWRPPVMPAGMGGGGAFAGVGPSTGAGGETSFPPNRR